MATAVHQLGVDDAVSQSTSFWMDEVATEPCRGDQPAVTVNRTLEHTLGLACAHKRSRKRGPRARVPLKALTHRRVETSVLAVPIINSKYKQISHFFFLKSHFNRP